MAWAATPPGPSAVHLAYLRYLFARLQVKVLKNNWGLIRAVERPTDVFFHFSNLVDVPEGELKVLNSTLYLGIQGLSLQSSFQTELIDHL